MRSKSPALKYLDGILKQQSVNAIAPLIRNTDDRQKKRNPSDRMPLFQFFQEAWDVLEPGAPLLLNWHQELICEYLELVADGKITRLILNMPPRYSKSTLVTICYPCWEWTFKPELRYIFASYSGGLSTDHSLARRSLIQSDWYQSKWGNVFRLAGDQNLKTQFSNTARGTMIATSMTGTVTGKGGKVIIDDPTNPIQAASDVQRSAANVAFDRTLSTRLNNKKTDPIIVVMQRLHEADLTGHLEKIGGYTKVEIRGVAEADEAITFPKSGKIIHRSAGDVLHPDREDKAEIELAKRQLGSMGFAGQYQQRPSPEGGGEIKRNWWKYYAIAPSSFDQLIQAWDCTFGDSKNADYVVGQVWGRNGADYYLIDQVRGRMDIVGTIAAVKALSAKHPKSTAKIVEAKANGQAVIDMLKRQVPGLIPFSPKESKVSRVRAIAPLIEAGNVHIPESAPWLSDFVEESAAFPNGANDDQVDCLSMSLLWMSQKLSAIDRFKAWTDE